MFLMYHKIYENVNIYRFCHIGLTRLLNENTVAHDTGRLAWLLCRRQKVMLNEINSYAQISVINHGLKGLDCCELHIVNVMYIAHQ